MSEIMQFILKETFLSIKLTPKQNNDIIFLNIYMKKDKNYGKDKGRSLQTTYRIQ